MMTIDETTGSVPESPPIGIGETGADGAIDLLTEEERKRLKRKRRLVATIFAVLAVIIAILIYRALTGDAPIPGILAPKLPHYVSSIYGTDRPMGVAVSPSGDRVYVTESDGSRLVRVFDRSGHEVFTLKPPGHAGRWRLPVYVAVDPMTDDVYVSDRLRRTVDIYKATGAYRGKFRPRGHLLAGVNPLGLAFSPRGDLYITDVSDLSKSYRVLSLGRDGNRLASPSGDRAFVTEKRKGRRLMRVYDRSGNLVYNLKPPKGDWSSPVYVTVGPLAGDVYVGDWRRKAVYVYNARGKYRHTLRLTKGMNPLGLAFGPRGDLYMTNVTGKLHQVLVFGRDGKLLRRLGTRTEYSFPNGIAIDSPGNTFVADSNHGRLAIFNPAGKPVASIRRGVGDGDLGLPRGVAVNADGRLYVVDTSNHTIKVYTYDRKWGKAPAYVGSFGQEGPGNGMFEYPNAVATDNHGRIYVTDRENNRVQIWEY